MQRRRLKAMSSADGQRRQLKATSAAEGNGRRLKVTLSAVGASLSVEGLDFVLQQFTNIFIILRHLQ